MSKKIWLKKNLSALIACASLITFNVPVFAASGASDVTRGGGNEESSEDVTDNHVEVNADSEVNNVITRNHGEFYAGYNAKDVIGGVAAEGIVEDNTVEINGGSIEGAIGGMSVVNSEAGNAAGDVVGNEVIMHGGKANYVSGGEVGYLYPRDGDETPDVTQSNFQEGGNVSHNKVKIEGGTVNGAVVGGSALSGAANNNSVEITGGTISGSIIGGMVRFKTDRSEATGNTITISRDEENNSPGPMINGVDLIGGVLFNNGDPSDPIYISSGNMLIISGMSNVNVNSINGFGTLDFTLPTTGDVIINITGGDETKLDGTTINVGSSGDNARVKNITEGNELQLNLIQNAKGLKLSNIKLEKPFMEGHSIQREITLLTDDSETIASFNEDNLATNAAIDSDGFLTTNGFHARVGKIIGLDKKADEITNDGDIPNHTAKNIIQNVIKDWKPPEEEFREIQDEDIEVSNEMKVFTGGNGNALRIKLSDGGHIRNNIVGLGIGGAKTLVNKGNGNHFSFAPLIDHGKGKFDTYTESGNHGKGDTQFSGGGFIARRMLTNGFYYEGSLHYGRAKSSFESNDFERDSNDSTYDSYDMSAPIIAGHINIGKLFAINRENTVHVYGQYLHSHQGSMSTHLLNGDHYEFDSVNDGTFIAGIRFINQPNRVNKFYSGFAYQYDHSSGSSAVCKGQRTHEVDSNGGSGMFELGWELKPHEAIPWVVDLGAIGWIGQQKGLTFHAKVKKSF